MALLTPFNEADGNYNYLRVKKSDWRKYFDCFNRIKKLVDKGKPIPKDLLKEYESYIENNNIEWAKHYIREKDHIKNEVLKYLEKQKHFADYNFSYSFSDEFPTFMYETATLDKLLTNVITYLFNQHINEIKDKGKDTIDNHKYVISLTVSRIQEYFNKIPVKKKEPYPTRKVYILAGVIVTKFNFHIVSNRKPFTIDNIYHAVYDCMNKKTKKPVAK